ncbi:FixH family protein [Solihabitans fulvus]|uniref:FixH family protein n=1 Tax=Solihabitans fulvus TaxID=1892852 RepID=UPI0016620AD1|nr:FixH family protein [Solihabitans fulvus]
MSRPRNRAVLIPLGVLAVVVAAVGGFLLWYQPDPLEVSLTGTSANYTVQLRFDHPTVGTNTVDIAVDRRDHGPVEVDRVALEAVMPRMGHAMPQLSAEPRGQGRFQARGELFLMAGVWTVSVRLHGAGGGELATVTLPVSTS